MMKSFFTRIDDAEVENRGLTAVNTYSAVKLLDKAGDNNDSRD